MAAATMQPVSVDSPGKIVTAQMQKKVLNDVLECIIQLKADFFENHQPITDDSVVLQRFCAKFEHLIQVGMKEKMSLMGRKKDYWDYFMQCLASARGSNDGIKYVKSLGENKTSLGRGRAFIRFCLVHQRLADTIQQCVVHERTQDWFLQSSLFADPKQVEVLVGALYDLNALHFDLSPRGYDLDSAWPSYANRKRVNSDSWNVPISRKSSITSMDTVSQVSVSVDGLQAERLAKDLEMAENAKGDMAGQIKVLQTEKEQASQSASLIQGELQALQQQLSELQFQHASLQERHKELDVNYAKMKMEKDYMADEIESLTEKVKKEKMKRVASLKDEEQIWKREVKEEGERKQREIDRLEQLLDVEAKKSEELREKAAAQTDALKKLMFELEVQPQSTEFPALVSGLLDHVTSLKKNLEEVTAENTSLNVNLQGEQSEKGKQLSHLDGRLVELERALKDSQDAQATLQSKLVTSKLELEAGRGRVESLTQREASLIQDLSEKDNNLEQLQREKEEVERRREELEGSYHGFLEKQKKFDAEVLSLESEIVSLKAKVAEGETVVELLKEELETGRKDILRLTGMNEVNSIALEANNSEIDELQEKVQAQGKEIIDLKKEAEKIVADHENALKVREAHFSETQCKLNETLKQLELINEEAGEIGEGNIVLREKISAVETERDSLKVKYADLEEKVIALEREFEEAIVESKDKDISLKEAEAKCDILKNEIVAVNADVCSAKSKCEKFNCNLKQRDDENLNLKTKVQEEKAERENLKRDMSKEKERMIKLFTESEHVKQSVGEKADKINSLIAEMEELKRGSEAAVSDYEHRINSLTEKLSERDSQVSSLNVEIAGLKASVEQQRSALGEVTTKSQIEMEALKCAGLEMEAKLQSRLTKAESDSEHIQKSLEHENNDLKGVVEKLKAEIGEHEKEYKSKCVEYEVEIEVLRKNVSSVTENSSSEISSQVESIQKLEEEMKNLTAERDHLIQQIEAALGDAQQIKSQLTETSEQLTHSYSQQENILMEKNTLMSQVTSMSEELTRLQDEKEEAKRKNAELEIQLRSAEDLSQEKISEKRQLHDQMEELSLELKLVTSRKLELEQEVEAYRGQTEFSTKVLEESLTEAQNSVEQLKAEKAELEEKLGQGELELTRIKEELAGSLSRIEQLETSSTPDKEEVACLQQELDDEKKKHLQMVEDLNDEISALQFQLSSEHMEEQVLAHKTLGSKDFECAELQSRISDLEIIIQQLEEEIGASRRGKEADSAQLRTAEADLERTRSECAGLTSRLSETESKLFEEQNQRETLMEEVSSLRLKLSQEMQQREEEIQMLNSDNEQIRKKLMQLLRDKDNLWHRTDQLVDEQKRNASSRWQDNSMVTHCPECNAEFSLFVRKHHCRHCGKIYCWACSDCWLDVAHSNKKARVCKPCFARHNNLDAMQHETSTLLLNASDDDADDDDVEQVLNEEDTAPKRTRATPSPLRNITDERKMLKRSKPSHSPSPDSSTTPGVGADGAGDEQEAADGSPSDTNFLMVSQEDVALSMSDDSNALQASAADPPNLVSSGILLAEELQLGKINRQNEVWIKPGKIYAVPVGITKESTTLHWEFTSQPKDIVFSVNFRSDNSMSVVEAEEVVAPCKCDSHKQTVRGELTTKKTGLYTLMFDNTYSRMTSKKIHYALDFRK